MQFIVCFRMSYINQFIFFEMFKIILIFKVDLYYFKVLIFVIFLSIEVIENVNVDVSIFLFVQREGVYFGGLIIYKISFFKKFYGSWDRS